MINLAAINKLDVLHLRVFPLNYAKKKMGYQNNNYPL